jgi:hypothetical protein
MPERRALATFALGLVLLMHEESVVNSRRRKHTRYLFLCKFEKGKICAIL